MKMTLFEVRNLIQPLSKLSSQDLPIKASWKILRISEKIEDLNKKIEEFRVDLVKKYGEEVVEVVVKDTGERIVLKKVEFDSHKPEEFSSTIAKIEVINQEKLDAFAKDFNSLLMTEEEIDIEPMTFEDLGDDIKLSPQDLFYLKKTIIQ